MADSIQERLYALLPALHRVRDAERGQPLRALLGIMETELQAIEDDIQGLYDSWFVETCDPWVVPYIADLIGLKGVQSEEGYSRRATVANTVAYRRRKGTASMLESLAYAETGWQARAVEFFQRLSTTQHLNHVRSASLHGVDIREAHAMDLVGGPFETAAHTAELRRIEERHGRYNIPNVGIMLWRLKSYFVRDATARLVYPDPAPPSGTTILGYTFDAIEGDVPLFNGPRTETELSHLATELDVPGRLRNRALCEALRDPSTWAEEYAWWFDNDEPAFRIRADGGVGDEYDDDMVPVERVNIFIPWRRADRSEEAALNDWEKMVPPEGEVLVDPERGRLIIHLSAEQTPPTEVRVDFRYGFSAPIGAGPYNRADEMGDDWDVSAFASNTGEHWQRGVSREHHQESAPEELDSQVYATLTGAIEDWNTTAAARQAEGLTTQGLIVVMDSRTYEETIGGASPIRIPPGCTLWIVAAGWDAPSEDSGLPTNERQPGSASLDGLRPHLRGDIEVEGGTDSSGEQSPGRLHLNGLRVEGSVTVLEGDLGGLHLAHCTVVPGSGTVRVLAGTSTTEEDANANLEITVRRGILGGIEASSPIASLTLEESIVDLIDATSSIDAPETDLRADACTILGATAARSVSATDTIFRGGLEATIRQEGCLRFCYVTEDSRAPRRYRCQPETALSQAHEDLHDRIASRLVPDFTSTTYGAPGYAQLRRLCPDEIRAGAEDGSEMGVFSFLKQPQRESNFRTALRQYLRFGLKAGIFFVT